MGKLYDVAALKQALTVWSQRLMLDRADIIDGTHAVAVKNLTNNEEFFNGHFPNHPIMPGVLQVEAMRQLAELLGAEKLAPAAGEYIYIKSMGKTRFRRP
ncbi:MAG: beta-hydroxyacyl-ACP dehydratase, partial [Lentisphaeria bacterium]|nr:beta-hydroxyacyl-ACP dehydratase [Lentisphaeria bacterium]